MINFVILGVIKYVSSCVIVIKSRIVSSLLFAMSAIIRPVSEHRVTQKTMGFVSLPGSVVLLFWRGVGGTGSNNTSRTIFYT